MAKTLVARGQATIHIQKDGYTISQSLGEYVFPADADGKILSTLWLRQEDGTPVRGEIAVDGETILTADFTSFSFYDTMAETGA